MKLKKIKINNWKLYSFLLLLSNSACRLVSDKEIDELNTSENMETWAIPTSFEFETTKKLKINLIALSPIDEALRDVYFQIATDTIKENSQNNILLSAKTDASGKFTISLDISSNQKYLFLKTFYVGLPQEHFLYIDGLDEVNYILGGKQTKSLRENNIKSGSLLNKSYTYFGTYSSQGVPNYLEPINDLVDASFLANINATLPENRPVPTYHPEYLANGNDTDLKITETADVWITFVHEGAGWRNVLGFYTYNLNNPPQTKEAIQNAKIIFPNASLSGSGGGLITGNKVKLGTFAANTGIGWFLIGNGWNGSAITNGNYTVYSNPNFNPETNPNLRQHNVLIVDDVRQRILIGFEDVRRDQGCDNDFNDAVFYVTANPFTAIQTVNMPEITLTGIDSDNDGVANQYDAYPNDPEKALNQYSPSATTYGTLAFEDLWPGRGDYDFNDLVLNYRFNLVSNGANQVKEIQAEFIVKAIGASYTNGFGFEIPVQASNIQSVTGSKITENYIQLASNGTESGQDKAVFIVFDNAFQHIPRIAGKFVNTEMDAAKTVGIPISITIKFTNPVYINDLGSIPFNPFIIINKERGKEVHLSNHTPTNLANPAYLGTLQDASNPTNGKYYRTANGLPYAIHIPINFDYSIEKEAINKAHLKFAEWAQSGGTSSKDWYLNKSNYRNTSKVYLK